MYCKHVDGHLYCDRQNKQAQITEEFINKASKVVIQEMGKSKLKNVIKGSGGKELKIFLRTTRPIST